MCHSAKAAPREPPASPAAGWIQILSNIFSLRIFPFGRFGAALGPLWAALGTLSCPLLSRSWPAIGRFGALPAPLLAALWLLLAALQHPSFPPLLLLSSSSRPPSSIPPLFLVPCSSLRPSMLHRPQCGHVCLKQTTPIVTE